MNRWKEQYFAYSFSIHLIRHFESVFSISPNKLKTIIVFIHLNSLRTTTWKAVQYEDKEGLRIGLVWFILSLCSEVFLRELVSRSRADLQFRDHFFFAEFSSWTFAFESDKLRTCLAISRFIFAVRNLFKDGILFEEDFLVSFIIGATENYDSKRSDRHWFEIMKKTTSIEYSDNDALLPRIQSDEHEAVQETTHSPNSIKSQELETQEEVARYKSLKGKI